MKSLVSWAVMLGLAGIPLLFSVFNPNTPVFAVPKKQVIDKLNAVPIFLITNSQGLPLSLCLSEAQNQQAKGSFVTSVYMSQEDAQAKVSELQKLEDNDPNVTELIKSMRVTSVPLGVIYQQIQQTLNQANRLLFAFQPVQREVENAMELLRASGQQVQEFKSVPLFAVRFAPNQGYVPITVELQQQELIPLFFSKQDAQNLLNQVKPQLKAADIQVIDLDEVISTLEEKNYPWLEQIVLIPDKAAREYIDSVS
ncbi:Tic22 family protein [Iningainema tapete]|uniref:Tic22-like protein n=1 Tax=Iningainema tapete BLCC-T55 TaxID=2748662 RepID=A0A8J6XSW8_9CYAN|nr:Tic22 family protein [Iningainema tapete]MBD2776916.1 hypothetical protein [Iningainema tapete BLCC-T55]